jgi:hypothetical protein
MLKVNHLSGFGSKKAVSGFDSDAQAFFTAASITDSTPKTAVNQLVLDLKTASIWSKMSAIYPFVGGDATKHSYNLKATGSHQITWNGTVTHDSNGITGNGSTGYGSTVTGTSTITSVNDNHLSFYSRSVGAGGQTQMEIGSYGVIGQDIYTASRYSSNSYMINGVGASEKLTATSNGSGFYVMTRRSSTDLEQYRNATSIHTYTGSNSGASLSANPIVILATKASSAALFYSTKNLAFASIGNGLTAGEVSSFNTAVQAFQTTLSRNV